MLDVEQYLVIGITALSGVCSFLYFRLENLTTQSINANNRLALVIERAIKKKN